MRARSRIACLAGTAALMGCHAASPGSPMPESFPTDGYVVDVVAEDYAFDAPEAIPSGWTTFRLHNEGEETHFVYLTRVEGHAYDDYVSEVAAPINEVWYTLRAGEIDKAQAGQQLGAVIPAWYWTNAVAKGGPGLVAPGATAQATVYLEPGSYIMECFMKTPDGELHWVEGMIRPLTVTAASNGASPPAADVTLSITADGYHTDGALTAGVRRIAVRFAEQPDIGFGHDVHLARLDDGTSVDAIIPWMDFLNVNGLENPAPVTFIGGVQERPEGDTAYFTVHLEPGRYAWISETADVYELAEAFVVR